MRAAAGSYPSPFRHYRSPADPKAEAYHPAPRVSFFLPPVHRSAMEQTMPPLRSRALKARPILFGELKRVNVASGVRRQTGFPLLEIPHEAQVRF